MDAAYKKRNRIPASCLVCRKRKSKCDRTRPVCGTCKKKLIAHLCVYEDDNTLPHASNTTYLPVAEASPRPHMQYSPGHPPSHLSHSSNFGPPGSHGPPPHLGGQMYPPPGAWAPGSGQYMDMSPQGVQSSQNLRPNLSPHLQKGHSFSSSHLQHQNSHLVSQQQQQQPLGSPPVFQYYQPRESVSSASSLQRRSSELASVKLNPLTVSQQSTLADQQPLQAEKEATRTVPQLQQQQQSMPVPPSQITLSTLSGEPSMITAPTSSGVLSSNLGKTSSDLSPSATISLVSSMAIPPSATKDHNSIAGSVEEVMFRSPQKRTFSQHMEEEKKKNIFVPVSIGSNVLQIDTNDTMESFSGASHSLLVEGSYWQQQGPVSYVGLTKSDPYIKLVRSFTLELFKSDQFSQFVLVRKRRQALMNSSPSSLTTNTASVSGGDESNKAEPSELSVQFDDAKDVENTSDSEVDIETEDGLIVTKIQADAKNTADQPVLPQFASLPGIQSFKSIYSSKEEYYSFVKSSVLQILPRKRSVYGAITRFFRYVSPFVPIFHESSLITELESLFHKNFLDLGDGYYTRLTIRSDNHLNLVGQLLLIIRLGYMTLIPNNETEIAYSQQEQDLVKDITRFKSDQYLSVVNLCIPEEKVQTKSTFKFVQALVLLHFYRSVAPNDCLGLSGSDSQLLFGAIANHALSIGLNRDPLLYGEINFISKSPTFVKQWRILWHYICSVDALQAMYCGTPLKIPSLDISDVEPAQQDQLSTESSRFFDKMLLIVESYRRIINKITNLRTKPKVIDVLQETSRLEKLFLEIFGTDFFRDYVCKPAVEPNGPHSTFDTQKHEESFMKVNRFVCFMHMRANLSCLYYLIALHYEHKLDQDKRAEIGAGIELFKIFIRSVIQLVYIMSYALDNSQELFGASYDYYLTSRIEKSMIKTHNFITSFFIRLVNYKRSLAVEEDDRRKGVPGAGESSDEDFNLRCEVVDSLFTIALIEAELFVGNFRVLSKTYINSYKLYVMAYFVLKQCMENPEKLFGGVVNNKQYFHDGTNMLQFLTIPELQSLCKLCEEFRVAKLELIWRQKKHSKSATSKKDNLEQVPPTKTVEELDPGKMVATVNDLDLVSVMLDLDSSFDVATANRAMYANENTINTYGILQEKHMHSDFQKEVFDEQSMIGNEELLKLFELYGDLDTMPI